MNKQFGLCSFLLLLATVAFADSFPAGSVTVALPATDATRANAAARQVLSVLQVADSVLAPAGFVRGQPGPQAANRPGVMTAYTRDVSAGSPTQCNVFLQNNRLIFSFVESGIPSPTAGQLSDSLARALRNQFGASAVEVQLK